MGSTKKQQLWVQRFILHNSESCLEQLCPSNSPQSHQSGPGVYPKESQSSATYLICGGGSCPQAGAMSQLIPHSVLTVPAAATALGLSWAGMREQEMQNPTRHYQPVHCQPGSCSCNVRFLFNTQGF